MKTWEIEPHTLAASVRPPEAAKLQELVKDLHVLEIGSFVGYSAWMMAQTAARVDCVEDFEWHLDIDAREQHPRNVLRNLYTPQDFLKNNFDLIHQGKIGLHIGRSLDIVPRFASNFDACFIDGNHAAEDVFTDLMLCSTVVRPGGMFIMHDWTFASVQEGWRKFENGFLRMWMKDTNTYETIKVPIQFLEGTSLAWFWKNWNW